MSGDVKRADRVAERLRAELMELLLRGAVRDPAAEGVLVSAVKVSDDLGHARIYIRLLETETDERRREAAVAAMTRATGFLRRELARRVRLRKMPELEFYWDEVVDSAARIESILEDVRADDEDEGGS